ncbi:Hypothetical protein PACV_4 [Pacmanvirus A23]|uniref:Hypothetical protein n=1 Tax=Pacmanvirus A23 TaxID=1932881 RepID=UPI000A095C79|nr:Hypothetical protein B9W72_gp004 [Pacmanvirus A23]SIP85721.1 Hypothetical protein PACV_4 [Pacmanvirus A23]
MANIADIINPSTCMACGEIRPILKGNCCEPCHTRFRLNRGIQGKAKYRLTPNGLYCLNCENVVKVANPFQTMEVPNRRNRYVKAYCSGKCQTQSLKKYREKHNLAPKSKIAKPQRSVFVHKLMKAAGRDDCARSTWSSPVINDFAQ